mgnify:CR=1 FL=1
MLPSGALRHAVLIEQRSVASDGAGDLAPTWTTFASPRASIEPSQGQERWVGERLMAEVDTIVMVRYVAGITPKTMRVKFGSRTFNLVALVNVQERNRELRLLCKEQL